jgi:hypothetical protein
MMPDNNDDAMDVETRVNANGMVMTMTMMPLLSTGRQIPSMRQVCQTHPKPPPMVNRFGRDSSGSISTGFVNGMQDNETEDPSIHATGFDEAVDLLEKGVPCDRIDVVSALGKLPYYPQHMRRHDYTVMTLDREGSLVRNPTDLMIKQALAPVLVAFQYIHNGVTHHCFSIRGTVTKYDWTVDGALSWELRIYQSARRTQYMHNLLVNDEANPLEYIHEGIFSFSMLAAGMIYQYLADVVPPPDSKNRTQIRMFGHSLGAATAMIVGHGLAHVTLDADIGNIFKVGEAIDLPQNGVTQCLGEHEK